jgi:hypothetical protein
MGCTWCRLPIEQLVLPLSGNSELKNLMPVTVTVIVLVADIQPEWEPDYGVRMKLAFYAAIVVSSSVCSKCAPTYERLPHK